MKATLKTIAMLSLSACIMIGGTCTSFAAAADSGYTAAVQGHSTHNTIDCNNYQYGEIIAQFTDASGASKSYTICADCGMVNGVSTLSRVSDAIANVSGVDVYRGKLDNSQMIMTVACFSSNRAAEGTVNVMMPKSVVENYDLYVVNPDGSESAVSVSYTDDWAHLEVKMQDGPALIRMYSQN